MSVGVVFDVCHGQLKALEAALDAGKQQVEECWKSEAHKRRLVADLRGIVRNCAKIPSVLNCLWDSTIDLIKAHIVEDYNALRAELQKAFGEGLHILRGIGELVQALERMGGCLPEASSLHEATDAVQRLEASIFEHWPEFTDADIAEARAESARGNCQTLEDAFAEIAGVDRETWLRHAEERRREKLG